MYSEYYTIRYCIVYKYICTVLGRGGREGGGIGRKVGSRGRELREGGRWGRERGG